MERPILVAKSRVALGTRVVRRMRREGLIPGVVYGKATSPIPVLVSRKDLTKFLHAQEGEHGLLTLRVEADPALKGKGGVDSRGLLEKPVLIKDIQHDPVDGEIVHIDFHVIVLTEQIRIKIPIVLKGEPVGVKEEGGILEHFLREVEVECLPTEIPKQVEHDISSLSIGDAIHVRDLVPPAGARITTELESVIASVLARKEEKIEEVAEAITEPEVIREKKPEAEEVEAKGEEEKKAEKVEKKEEKKAEKAEKKEDKKEKEEKKE